MSAKLFCLLSFFALPLAAAEPWTLPLFTADPRTVLAAASRYALPERLNAFTIDYSVQAQLDPSGKMTKSTRSVTRVLRLQGIDGARRISVPWIEWRENRPKIKARVITADGRAHLLDESTIDETPPAPQTPQNRSASSGPSAPVAGKLLSAVLPAVDIDSVVELEIDESDREAVLPGARLAQIAVESPFLVGHFKLTISAPSSSPLRAEPRGFPDPPRISPESTGAMQQVTVEASNFYPGAAANFVPPELMPRPVVTFTNVASWQAVAQWYAPILNKAAAPREVLRSQTGGEQLAAVENAFEDLRKKVHDTGTALGVLPYTPVAPAETTQKGSGDSKDEAVLLISKLAEIGIAAKPALISLDPHPEIARALPGFEAFKRVLVYIGGEHPLWIDPSAEFTPVSRLPLADQNRWALIIDPSTTDLVRTPTSTAADNRQTDTVEVRLRDGAKANIVQTLEGHGAFEDFFRSVANAINGGDSNEKENAQQEFARLSGFEQITNIDAGDPHKLLTPTRIQLTGEGFIRSQVTDAGGVVDLPGQLSSSLERIGAALQLDRPSSTQARKFDYYIPPAFTAERNYHVLLPSGYRFSQLPVMSSLTIGPLQLSAAAKLDADGSLWVNYTLINPKQRYTPEEVAAMRRDISKVAARSILRITFLNTAMEKLDAGELKEAVTLLRHEIASAPANTNARLRLAGAYVVAGARPAALHICNEVLSKDPNNAAAYMRLGWAYTHDEFGRLFGPGMNMPEAEKAYLKAMDIDPQPAYAIELATLYTYNSAGIRFGNSARLEDALHAYRQAGLDTLAKIGAINDYALTLLFAGKYSDLRQLFLYSEADRADPALKLAGIAAESADDVKSEAAYMFPDAAKRKTALVEAARYLLNAREFEPAARLFDLSGVSQANSTADLALIRKARKFDDGAASQQPAIAAFQRLITTALDGPDPEAWKKFVVPEARDLSISAIRPRLLQLWNGRAEATREPSTWPFISDLLATALDFTAEGSPEAGFRIRASDRGQKSAPKTVAYVVKRGNEYLVLGFFGAASDTAEAFKKAESGDLAAARQWLDWAADELPRAKASDPLASPPLLRLWPPKSSDPMLIKAAAASLAARQLNQEHALETLNQARQQIADPDFQAAIDQALGESLFAHAKYNEAIPVLERLKIKWPDSKILANLLIESWIDSNRFAEASSAIDALARTDPGSLAPMRLRARLLAEQQKFQESAALQTQICVNSKATAGDWNDLAWVGLFAHADEKSMQQAAEKAAELSGGRNTAVLHTLAVVQASTGQLKAARANASRLLDASADPDELLTVFGRIAEQLDLRDVAVDDYTRVKKPQGNPVLSAYAFAQMRLREVRPAASPNSAMKTDLSPKP